MKAGAGMLALAVWLVCAEAEGVTLKEPRAQDAYVYYLVESADGTLRTVGPGKSEYPASFGEEGPTAGLKAVRWRAVELSGRVHAWHEAGGRAGGAAKEWEAPVLAGRLREGGEEPRHHVLTFPGHRRLTSLSLQAPEGKGLPAHFDVEVSVDGGGNWQPVPRASLRHFPEIAGCRLIIPLHGLNADAVRVVVHRDTRRRGLSVMEARGDEAFLFDAGGVSGERLAAWNNLYVTYGPAETEVWDRFSPIWPSARPFSGGMAILANTEWALWNTLQYSWTGSRHLSLLEANLVATPLSPDGYVWVAPNEEKHLNHSRHPVATAVYLSAIARHYLHRRERDFLERRGGHDGRTLLEKVPVALNYLLDELGAREGLAVIPDPGHQGRPDDEGSNYWDAWKFGHLSAYLNLYIYRALRDTAELYRALERRGEAAELEAAARGLRARFHEAFWADGRQRYIGWEDVGGERYDFGFTFVNLPAITSGVAQARAAERIMEWIEGRRLVEGDWSAGEDLYRWELAVRGNTVAAETLQPAPWGDFFGNFLIPEPGKPGEWEANIQNGGAIFYLSYHDLHARLRVSGAGSALRHFRRICDGAVRDGLRRMPDTRFTITYPVGVIREFSESGIVPIFFLDGFMGLRAGAAGLEVRPQLPESWDWARVRRYHYAGEVFDITVSRQDDEARLDREVHPYRLVLPAGGRWLLSPDGSQVEPLAAATGPDA